MKYDNQLRYAVNIIRDYDGRYPLASWLKDFFKSNPQMGSRDRKTVSSLVYGYFRLGKNVFASVEERVIAGLAATRSLPEILAYFQPTYPAGFSFSKPSIFPWSDQVSEGIDTDAFTSSFLVQPDVFIRIRPGKRESVITKLRDAGIVFQEYNRDCIGMPNATRIDQVLTTNEEAVVQDKSSQQTGMLLDGLSVNSFWDCCAGSGGKSIMLHDRFPKAAITVSDIRESIVANLKERFREAGIRGYQAFVSDLANGREQITTMTPNLIIADVPCTGSGTWARTPEQLVFFSEEKLVYYRGLQEKIVDRAVERLLPGAYFLYITCSVFKKENEEMVGYINSRHKLRVLESRLIAGYRAKADSMFVALFTSEAVSA